MNYFLIDYENVKTDGIKNLSGINEGDTIFIFYSDQCKNISLDIIDSINSLDVKLCCHKVKTGMKNALDFQLSSYLGYLMGKGNGNDKYHIVSNDKGYDCLCDYWKEQGKFVDRIAFSKQMKATAVPTSSAVPKEKKSKVQASDLATLAEIKKYLSDDEAPEQVLLIFNQYKTKQAICNDMAKKFKDNKKASAIYKKLKPLLKEKNKS